MTSAPPQGRLPSFHGILRCLFLVSLGCFVGCGGPRAEPDHIWGRRGTRPGDLVKPRAAAVDAHGWVYLVDWTARIQVFDRDGNYQTGWKTPDFRNGRPSGLSMDRDGNLMVSDSHYHCVRIYAPDGTELRVLGGQAGAEPGQLGYVSDAVQDEDGNYYIAEFGETQRITKLDHDGKYVASWGTAGVEPGQFSRIRALALGPDGNLYVADACNHRIQVFTRDGKLVRWWGGAGNEQGQLYWPYDLAFGPRGELYVVEYGNQRVQKFTAHGKSLGCWGSSGKQPGQLSCPWALAVDPNGAVLVIDSENHRVQRITF